MKHPKIAPAFYVKSLTLFTAFFLCSCSYINSFYEEECNFRAYLRSPLEDYLTRRYDTKAPVRMAVVPFSAPANLAAQNTEHPGLGNQLAWALKDEMLAAGIVPIVEILNRQDWPGKKEEFFTGNFGALAMARAAGYDLVLVGYINQIGSLTKLSAQTKLMEVETGITIWNGVSTVTTDRPGHEKMMAKWWYSTRRPDKLYMGDLRAKLAGCIRDSILEDETVP